ncbi:hypothetical protein NQ317_003291 [Molorchus minor]|uniref:TOG domain-containing protein n=1 Tax=Molorchus minor TaxID=1323400 RepID=A0ABQ9JL73_9CUCU|nr:hypothetical protein NQ317_003291 [Molorchus minor]
MYNKSVPNPWGLRETRTFKWPILKCCPCIYRNGKVSDVNGVSSRPSTPVLAITLPPESAEKSALGSPVESPINSRSSPKESGNVAVVPMSLPLPPRSSGSESSGYFTPPSDKQQAFVKLANQEHVSEFEEIVPVNDDHNNNNTPDCIDSFTSNSPNSFVEDTSVQRIPSYNSLVSSDHNDNNENQEMKTVDTAQDETNYIPERGRRRLIRYSSSSLKEPAFTEIASSPSNERRKSKSVVDLQSFLPEIASSRKSANSAPPLNGDITYNNLIISNIDDTPITPSKTITPVTKSPVPAAVEPMEEIEYRQEETTRKLPRRFTRSQSKKSTMSTPKSVRETPKSSRPNSKPKDVLQQSLVQLNSSEWEMTLQGLQGLSKVSKQHPDVVEAHIHAVCVTLARHIKNLRSQVARSACRTASDLFSFCKKGLDIELEEIAGPLLQRTADTNKFLRADANAALDIMSEQFPAHRVIVIVTGRGITHPNCIVRSSSMRLINDIVKRFGADKVFQMQKELKDKILWAGATSLTDGSLDTRSHAKAMFSHLVGHPQFHKALVEAVPQNTLRHIAKTLSSIKPA